jgi:hypothetical protein
VKTIAVHAHGTAQIRDAWRRYLVTLLRLTTIFLIVTFACWPWHHTFAADHWVLPEYETAFGFWGGSVVVGEGEYAAPIYAIVQYGLWP